MRNVSTGEEASAIEEFIEDGLNQLAGNIRLSVNTRLEILSSVEEHVAIHRDRLEKEQEDTTYPDSAPREY